MKNENLGIIAVIVIVLIGILLMKPTLFSIIDDSSRSFSATSNSFGLNTFIKSDTDFGENTINNVQDWSAGDIPAFTSINYYKNTYLTDSIGLNIISSFAYSDTSGSYGGGRDVSARGIDTLIYTELINFTNIELISFDLNKIDTREKHCSGNSVVSYISIANSVYLVSDTDTEYVLYSNSEDIDKVYSFNIYKDFNDYYLKIDSIPTRLNITDGSYRILLRSTSSRASTGEPCTASSENTFKITNLNLTQKSITESSRTFYRFSNNSCSPVSIKPSNKTINDYEYKVDCESHILTPEGNRTYFRLTNNTCNTISIKPSEKTNNDYENSTLCDGQIDSPPTGYDWATIKNLCMSTNGSWDDLNHECDCDGLTFNLDTGTKGCVEECTFYYWIDKDNKECAYDKFCGAYMYEGLETFDTLEKCEENKPNYIPYLVLIAVGVVLFVIFFKRKK